MRTSLVGALAWLAVACGGGSDDPAAEPFTTARSDMCGAHPTGTWKLEVTSPVEAIPGQQVRVCAAIPFTEWDFDSDPGTTVYDQGCTLNSTSMDGDQLRAMWVADGEWSGIVAISVLFQGITCDGRASVKLTRP